MESNWPLHRADPNGAKLYGTRETEPRNRSWVDAADPISKPVPNTSISEYRFMPSSCAFPAARRSLSRKSAVALKPGPHAAMIRRKLPAESHEAMSDVTV